MPPADRAARRRWWLAAGIGTAIAVAAIGSVVVLRGGPGGSSSAAIRTPLASDSATLACPILEVDDPDHAGWLGAAAGALVPHLRETVGLAGVADAMRAMERGHGRGKIVVDVAR